MTSVSQRLEAAREYASDAGRFILSHYQQSSLVVDRKRDRTPVTVADRGAEELIRARIAADFPGDAILGEELGETPGTSGFQWILDPVDGTKSFIHGVPLFGTLIGIEEAKTCVAGVCRFPALDEMVYASQGNGTWWERPHGAPQRAEVSKVNSLADALFCLTTISGWASKGKQAALDRFLQAAELTRGWGDCYGHALVATGRAEVMIDTGMNPWDAAALLPILQEAGGCFCDWSGQPTIYSGNGLSVNAALRDQVLQMLNAPAS